MFTTCLLVVEVMLIAMAAIAVLFRSFFLTEFIDLEEIASDGFIAPPRVKFYLGFGLLLLFTAGAVEALRRVIECANRTDRLARVQDVDTGYEVLAPETPSAAAGASSIPQNRTSAPLAEDACTSPVPVIAVVNDHHDGDALHAIVRTSDATEERQALYYWLGSIAFILVGMVLMYVFVAVLLFISYNMFTYPQAAIQTALSMWSDVHTKSDAICPFMEAHRCSGGPVLCEYPNVILPNAEPFRSEQCPVCDFSGRREPLVVQSTCVDLAVRHASSAEFLYLFLSFWSFLLVLVLWVWLATKLVVRLVRSCFSARVQPTLSTVPAM